MMSLMQRHQMAAAANACLAGDKSCLRPDAALTQGGTTQFFWLQYCLFTIELIAACVLAQNSAGRQCMKGVLTMMQKTDACVMQPDRTRHSMALTDATLSCTWTAC